MNDFIGIDVSKDFLDVSSLSPDNTQASLAVRHPNMPGTAIELAHSLLGARRIVVEATGGYEQIIVQALSSLNVPVSIVNPKRIRDFARSLGQLAKTDNLDAQVLALFAKTFEQQLHDTTPCIQPGLKELVAHRQDLVKSLVQYKNRYKQASNLTKDSIQRLKDNFQQEIKLVDEQIKALLKPLPAAKILQEVSGVGFITTATLLANMTELGHINAKQAAALAGLAPFNCDSGQMRGRRFCWGGRQQVRNVLYMAAHTARQFDDKMKAFYDNLIAKGKPYKVAITACARKLLGILNAKLRDHYALIS